MVRPLLCTILVLWGIAAIPAESLARRGYPPIPQSAYGRPGVTRIRYGLFRGRYVYRTPDVVLSRSALLTNLGYYAAMVGTSYFAPQTTQFVAQPNTLGNGGGGADGAGEPADAASEAAERDERDRHEETVAELNRLQGRANRLLEELGLAVEHPVRPVEEPGPEDQFQPQDFRPGDAADAPSDSSGG